MARLVAMVPQVTLVMKPGCLCQGCQLGERAGYCQKTSGAMFLGSVAKAHLWDQSGFASAGITHKTDPNKLLSM